jgi:GNAT superfamily N-acetyltransferase
VTSLTGGRLSGVMEIRNAALDDVDTVAELAAMLAQSYPFDRGSFGRSYQQVLGMTDAALLIAADGDRAIGYVLGFRHPAFFANGPVAWVEEILVRTESRGTGLGRALMRAFEEWAAGCVLVSLATRRAAPFYEAIGYAESAVYLRKEL